MFLITPIRAGSGRLGLFNEGEGDDTITDFADGTDVINLAGTSLQFADLIISDSSEGAVVDLAGHGTITLEGINSAVISQDDFLIA